MSETERYQMVQKHVRKQKEFWIHLALFVVVNAGLITLNLVKSPDKLWFYWVLIGWGAGLLLNGFKVFGGEVGKNWEARKINAILKRDEESQESRPKSSNA